MNTLAFSRFSFFLFYCFHRQFFVSKVFVLISSVVNDVVIGAGSSKHNPWVGQIGHSVANGSPPLRRFFGAVFKN